MQHRLTTLLALSTLSAAPPENRPTNLLPDPSFEEASLGKAPGWRSRAWHGEKEVSWEVASPGRQGDRCLTIRSDLGGDAAWTATVTVEPHAFYRLSGWIRTKDLGGARGALLNIQNLQHVKTQAVTGTSDWTHVSTLFSTGKARKLEINCLFGGWGSSTGQAWYDDVVLECVDDLKNATEAVVTVDVDAKPIEFTPLVFGGFIEHFHRQIYGGLFDPGSPLSDERGFRKDVMEALKELNLSVVRWPGGCFASGYHWRDGVGQERRPTRDPVWGVEDPNTFGTEEFVAWCDAVGCEAYICTNAGNGTVEEMRDWLQYCVDHSLEVPFWSIGNENWGGHEIGAKTPEEWGPLVAEAAEALLAVDPQTKLVAAATDNRDWTLPLLEAAGKDLDYVAIHRYWLPCWGENLAADYLSCIIHSEGPEQLIQEVIGVLDEAGVRGRVQIAFDEWNLRGWHHPGFPRKELGGREDAETARLIANRDKNLIASQYTMADALFSASFLNACLRHADDVGMANIAPIVNTRGPLAVHPDGIVKRTTFHVLSMYAQELQPRVAPTDVNAGLLVHKEDAIPVLDAIATVNASGKTWSIALVNRHPSKQVSCTINLGKTPLCGTVEGMVLEGDGPEAYNDVESPDRVVPQKRSFSVEQGKVLLPPHSLTVLTVSTPQIESLPQEDYVGYLMAYFGPEEKLFYGYSQDARHWKALNAGKPVFDAGCRLRDPYIQRARGAFHMVHTKAWDHPEIFHWQSPDLIHWTGGSVQVVDPERKRAWAPEFVYCEEKDLFTVFWASIYEGHNTIHYTTTRDWTDMEPSRSQVYFNIGIHDIDLSIVEHHGIYYGFHKPGDVDDLMGNRFLTSTSLDPAVDRFSDGEIGDDVLPSQKKPTEGPEIVKRIGEDRWLIYGDPFHAEMEAWETTDFCSFKKIDVSPPPGAKHCSMFPITKKELDRLVQAYPSANVVQ